MVVGLSSPIQFFEFRACLTPSSEYSAGSPYIFFLFITTCFSRMGSVCDEEHFKRSIYISHFDWKKGARYGGSLKQSGVDATTWNGIDAIAFLRSIVMEGKIL